MILCCAKKTRRAPTTRQSVAQEAPQVSKVEVLLIQDHPLLRDKKQEELQQQDGELLEAAVGLANVSEEALEALEFAPCLFVAPS